MNDRGEGLREYGKRFIEYQTAVIREAVAVAMSQKVASGVTTLIVASMVATIMLTTGRTVGVEQEVLASIDDVGTRSITVRADTAAGITGRMPARTRDIEGIDWVAAFSTPVDATNAAIPDGARVPLRYIYSEQLETLGVEQQSHLSGKLAYASAAALDQLGMADAAGGISTTTGGEYAIAGQITTPDFLTWLEPLILVPRSEGADSEVITLLVVVAATPDLVAPVSDVVLSVLAAEDPTLVTVQTSEEFAALRALIHGQIGSYGRGLIILAFGTSGVLVATVLYGLVLMRRRDFGRRRALGASRALIIQLLLAQTLLLASAGVIAGTAVAVFALIASSHPLPSSEFVAAIAVLAIATTIIAALIPAVLASRREPIRELRVP